MQFAIRDDDTSYFTSAEELDSLYGKIMESVPVSLAVIPHDVPSFHRGEPEKFRQEDAPISIEENGALVDYLRDGVKRECVDVMLHGYNHLYKVLKPVRYTPKYWIPEFMHVENPEEKITRGKILFERLFESAITTFVPPSNAISPAGLRALAKVGLNLAGLTGRRAAMHANPLNLGAMAAHQMARAYPYGVRRYIGHKQVLCHALTPVCDWDALCDHLERCSSKRGVFVVATHYWELSKRHEIQKETLHGLLQELIDRAKRFNAEFSSVSAVFGR